MPEKVGRTFLLPRSPIQKRRECDDSRRNARDLSQDGEKAKANEGLISRHQKRAVTDDRGEATKQDGSS